MDMVQAEETALDYVRPWCPARWEIREINLILNSWWDGQRQSTAKPAIPGLTTVASERFIAPLDGIQE